MNRLVQAGALLVALAAGGAVAAQSNELDAPLEEVQYSDTDTLRGIAETYLRDPDLWPNVLTINGIGSPADLVPGMILRLPVKQVMAADRALIAALEAIQKANAEGAQIFAPVEIGTAIQNRDSAITRREAGDWRDSVGFSGVAAQFANEALNISIAQRDRSAEAVVSDVQGRVEGRAPAEPTWTDRALNDVLVEFERLRTLSGSTTQITFRDLSRLRLNPNSNATIQRMRSDPLTGGEVTKVSLVNGDFYALLNQLSERTQFEIEVPGVETTTNSGDFWIKNDQTGARFVNYDKPGLEIVKGNDRITLGENEGVVLSGTGSERASVLTSPRLVAPDREAVLYSGIAALQWDRFEGAEGYWLEVALDPGFNQMQISEWGIRENGFTTPDLPPAQYHWRVAALDRLGLPGEWSKAQDFTVRVDKTPPFLTLLSPGDGQILTAPQVDVLGATEPGVQLTLNGQPLAVGSDGSFLVGLTLVPGPNTVQIDATDAAGNRSTRSQQVIYRPAVAVEIVLSPAIARIGEALATRSDTLSVSGTTTAAADAPVVVRDSAGSAAVQTRVGAGGTLTFTVPVDEAPRPYTIEVLAPDGSTEGSLTFTAVRDSTPPAITLDLPMPKATGEPDLVVEGSAGDAVSLSLGGQAIALEQGRFRLSLTLVPGENGFDLVATDAVGNVSAVRLQTLYDIEPPEILSVRLGRPSGADGPIEIEVEARDASGLRQAAPYLIEVDGAEREGFMRCDSAAGICRATLPPEPGTLELIELIVEDYAGNAAFE